MSESEMMSSWVDRLDDLETSALETSAFDEESYAQLFQDIVSNIRPSYRDVLYRNIIDYAKRSNKQQNEKELLNYSFFVNKKVEKFSFILFAIVTYYLEYPSTKEEHLHRVEDIVHRHNIQEKMAFSVPFAAVVLVNYIYDNTKNLGAVIELTEKWKTLPDRYRYWTIALGLFVHAMHIRSEQLGEESLFDFQMHLSSIEIALQVVNNDFPSHLFSSQEIIDLKEACNFGLAQMILATLPYFYERGEILTSRVQFHTCEKLPLQYSGPLGVLFTKNKEALTLSLIAFVNNCMDQKMYLNGMTHRWFNNLFYNSTLCKYAGSIRAEKLLTLPFKEEYQKYFLEFWSSDFDEIPFTNRIAGLVHNNEGEFCLILDSTIKGLIRLNIEYRDPPYIFPVISS